MRSSGNNFNYFSENKLAKLANLVQFIRRPYAYVLSGGLGDLGPLPLLATPLRLIPSMHHNSADIS